MTYTADDPYDLGFISTYVRNSSGQLVASVGDASVLTPTDAFHYYEFTYPPGVISVTIELR